MKTGLIASLAVGFLLMTGVAAADLAKARLLYESRLFDDAKRELIAVASSATSAVEKAAALHLLGTIAVAAITAMQGLGSSLNSTFTNVSTAMAGSNP